MASLHRAEAMTGYTEMLQELVGVFPDLDTHRALICEVRDCKGCSRLPSTGNRVGEHRMGDNSHLPLEHWNALQAPGIKAYLHSEKRHPWPEGDTAERYVRNVQTVLQG